MIKYSIWLQNVLGYASLKVAGILDFFGSAKAIYDSDINTLKSSGLFSVAELKRAADKDLKQAEAILEKCENLQIKVIPFGSELYPYCLSVIENPPAVLYVKGNLPDFDNKPAIAIVGPRKVSEFGKKAAYSLSFRLARAGFTIVSGGALGCDSYAHAGALKADEITVLVLGCGIGSNYLQENENLRRSVCEKGCLISEYPPETPANRYTFPVRNRIISALSLGTVVIEAGVKSGALITAKHANEQGRDVFVIPNSLQNKEFLGSNQLLRDGAKPLLDVSDIFNEYIIRFPDKINIERAYEKPILVKSESKKMVQNKKIEKNLNETLSKNAKIVYNCLDKQKFTPEEILATGLSDEEILSALTELEFEFYIKALPGGFYEKC